MKCLLGLIKPPKCQLCVSSCLDLKSRSSGACLSCQASPELLHYANSSCKAGRLAAEPLLPDMPTNPQATSCSGPSRVFHSCVLQGVTNNTLSYLLCLKQLQGTKREALQGHLCYLAHKDQGDSSRTKPFSTETAPAFIPWTCFVLSQFMPLRMSLQHRGLALAGLEAISITQLVRSGVNF